ncbi:MAG TPA: TetR/AcrR family transcriptional regulator [Candidatus Acidoferrum sp.]|nr:TetR/AcrR family transcriptional regulator [Candidatus Acidoferrum sp.]
MPRRPDPDLEGRILDAAQKLWKEGGEKELTMRTVAEAAGTNTPAVYRRFRDRDDIVRGLIQRTRLEFTALMHRAASPEQAGEFYIDFALSHRHEYELFFQHEYEMFYSRRSTHIGKKPGRPAVEIMKGKIAEKLGGFPDDYTRLTVALWMLAHGAAMLLISKAIPPKEAKIARAVFIRSVRVLLHYSNEMGRR